MVLVGQINLALVMVFRWFLDASFAVWPPGGFVYYARNVLAQHVVIGRLRAFNVGNSLVGVT